MTDEGRTSYELIYRGHRILLQRVAGQWTAAMHVTGHKPIHLTGVSEQTTREMAEAMVVELVGFQSSGQAEP